jgi:hypothetical protein
MLTITAQKISENDRTIDIQVSVTAQGADPGIASVKVVGIDQVPLDTEQPNDCPINLSFFVKAVPRISLPLYIEATECPPGVDQSQADPVQTDAGPFFREEAGLGDCSTPEGNKNNPVCVALQKRIQFIRNSIQTECGKAAALRSKRDALAVGAAALMAIAVGLAVVTAMAPWPVNLILGILAAAVAIGAAIASGLAIRCQSDLDDLLRLMDQERELLTDLIGRLPDVCCPDFITVSQDVPVCPN